MAMDGNSAAGAPRFTVGGTITASLSAVFANILRFLAIILVIGVPVTVLIVLGSMIMIGGAAIERNVEITLGNAGSTLQILFIFFAIFLGMLAYFLIQAALTHGTLQHLRGQRASIGACISSGFAALPRVFLASLILTVIAGLAVFLLFFVLQGLFSDGGGAAVGIILMLILFAVILYAVVLIWVFVPAIVVERAGALECFGRSMELTKGHRWGIFAILLLVGAANWVISLLSQFLSEVAPVAGGVIDIASGLFFLAFGSVIAAVGYYYLRAEKEGVQIDDLAGVFD